MDGSGALVDLEQLETMLVLHDTYIAHEETAGTTLTEVLSPRGKCASRTSTSLIHLSLILGDSMAIGIHLNIVVDLLEMARMLETVHAPPVT